MVKTLNRQKRTANISTFNIGTGLSANFFEQTENGEEGLVKKALVAVEGTFKDSTGREHTFDSDRLVTIADHTNKALATGTTIPLCTDHKKEFSTTVGSISSEGSAYTKVIEPEDLPNSRSTHLLGKLGLFLNDVAIKSREAIDKVANGIVTSVSMGLNLDPKDHRIMELSLVPIPAIPNMGLFKFGAMADNQNVFTWEELESNEQTLEDLKEEYDMLTQNLWLILNNIYNSESLDINDITALQQYVYSALNGFNTRTLDMLGLGMTDPNAGMGMDPMGQTLSADQQMQMQQTQLQDMQQPAAYNRRLTDRFVANFTGCNQPKYVRVRR